MDVDFHSYEEVVAEIEAGVRDTIGDDDPGNVGADDAAHEIAVNYLSRCDPATRHLLARCFLGWDPEEDRDLYVKHDIPTEGERYKW